MEYPSFSGMQDDSVFDMTYLLPPSPKPTCAATQGDRDSSPDSSPRHLEEQEEELRKEEQRIRDARRRAGDKSDLRGCRMVVMDNRFAPKKAVAPERPSSVQVQREKAQERENEERCARVQAFLEQRRRGQARGEEVKQGRTEEGEEKGERPAKLPKRSSTPQTGQERAPTERANPTQLHYRRWKYTTKGPMQQSVAAPCLESVSAEAKPPREAPQVSGPCEPQNVRSGNQVHSLVIVHKEREDAKKPAKIKVLGEAKLEIHQDREPPLFLRLMNA
ncbi:uncharacterized protein Tco025E_07572 [Trypanosoma conorhini]|uniref:Uncharacterized protein n=1 Tax=Trypanosoma conorhini TaxID=83891 RepID=A0A3R7KIG4_9TRYP|nr:uncharacterized protein Tco025E_07572 [Trypanosoma conorhini]RNF07102.1 hypothetical protein Tco025E_07572 [Trypanosoma conorhini]